MAHGPPPLLGSPLQGLGPVLMAPPATVILNIEDPFPRVSLWIVGISSRE